MIRREREDDNDRETQPYSETNLSGKVKRKSKRNPQSDGTFLQCFN